MFFTETEQTLLRCVWNHKGPGRAKATLRKEHGPEASPSLTSHHMAKRQPPKQCGTGSKQAHRPEGRDGEPRTHPARAGSVNSRRGGHGHTERKGSPTENGAGKTAHPTTHAAPPRTSLTENPALHAKPFRVARRRAPSAVSRPQEASPHFSSPSPHLIRRRRLRPQETQLPSAWTQPHVVLKPKLQRVLRRPSSCRQRSRAQRPSRSPGGA